MVGGATPSTWNFGWTGPRWSEIIADYEPIFARRASVVISSEKSSISTNRKSTTRFPISRKWALYVAPKPPIGLKTQNGRFPSKIALRLKKVCYKVSFCENCQRESCKAFICLSVYAKMIGGDVPLYVKICRMWLLLQLWEISGTEFPLPEKPVVKIGWIFQRRIGQLW